MRCWPRRRVRTLVEFNFLLSCCSLSKIYLSLPPSCSVPWLPCCCSDLLFDPPVLHPAARVGLFAFSDHISIFNLRSGVAVLHHCVLSQEGGSEVPLEDVLARDSLFVRVSLFFSRGSSVSFLVSACY
jgi:hypothetical protein